VRRRFARSPPDGAAHPAHFAECAWLTAALIVRFILASARSAGIGRPKLGSPSPMRWPDAARPVAPCGLRSARALRCGIDTSWLAERDGGHLRAALAPHAHPQLYLHHQRRGKNWYGLARATQDRHIPAAWGPSAMLRPTRPHYGLRCARASRPHNGQARSAWRRAEQRRPQACAACLPRADFRGLRARARCGLRCAGVRALHGFLGWPL